jgi:hypothetical protein
MTGRKALLYWACILAAAWLLQLAPAPVRVAALVQILFVAWLLGATPKSAERGGCFPLLVLIVTVSVALLWSLL